MTAIGKLCLEILDGANQQRRLARAGRRHQIERQRARRGKARAVLPCSIVVLGENIAFDADHALAIDVGLVHGGKRRRVHMMVSMIMHVVMVVRVIVVVVVIMAVVMIVGMIMIMRMAVQISRRLAIDLVAGAARAATAILAHHSTSSSRNFSSSPCVICTWRCPQSGQAPKRSVIGTVLAHSRHQPVPGTRSMTSLAFSARVPWPTAEKQKAKRVGINMAEHAHLKDHRSNPDCAILLRFLHGDFHNRLAKRHLMHRPPLLGRHPPQHRERIAPPAERSPPRRRRLAGTLRGARAKGPSGWKFHSVGATNAGVSEPSISLHHCPII